MNLLYAIIIINFVVYIYVLTFNISTLYKLTNPSKKHNIYPNSDGLVTTQWQKSEMCDTLFRKIAEWESLQQKSHCFCRFQGEIIAFVSPVRDLTIKSKIVTLSPSKSKKHV